LIPDTPSALTIRPARADDLAEAQQIVNLAFATQFGLPSPAAFGDRMMRAPRWHTDPASILIAEDAGGIAGSNAITTWGRFGWFGPLTVHPERWNHGIARALLDATMQHFAARGTTTEGLFTIASSPKHVALYQKYGFWPRRLTALLARAPDARTPAAFRRLSALDPETRAATLHELAALTGAIWDGLDVTNEIRTVEEQRIGDVLVVDDADGASAFAVCHHGLGSEAGSAAASVKFGAARGAAPFRALLAAIVAYAGELGVERVLVSVNTAREGAYRSALEAGFSIAMLGIAMVRGGDAYDHPDAWVIEDHR
jgi:N-acetylglutamate synthase-like GNAT family acetyltransferase